MLSKISVSVKAHLDTIALAMVVILLVLLSFAMGYIIATYQNRPPLQVEQIPSGAAQTP